MAERTLDDETRYQLLRRLADEPGLSQRQLAREFGISLGKTNYCLNALLGKGYIKAGNFKNNHNKRAYLYQLTPAGIAAKSRATTRFLARKQAEYERLAREIEALQREAEAQTDVK
jgi:EPS-associated MarR family transcriptional regulator